MNDHKPEAILEVRGIRASYKYHTLVGGKEVYQETEVVHGIDVSILKGEIVAIMGANGAGKSTLMLAIMGLLDREPFNGRFIGEIIFNGRVINGLPAERIVKLGISLVPEGKLLFPSLSVSDNLELGTYPIRGELDKETRKRNLATIFRLFPALKDRQKQLADRLSGGEAQMVAVARGILSQPQLLLLDEPCLGLAPLLVRELMGSLSTLRNEFGISIFLAEQNALAALSIADRGYLLKMGQVVARGSTQELLASESIKMAYLGQ